MSTVNSLTAANAAAIDLPPMYQFLLSKVTKGNAPRAEKFANVIQTHMGLEDSELEVLLEDATLTDFQEAGIPSLWARKLVAALPKKIKKKAKDQGEGDSPSPFKKQNRDTEMTLSDDLNHYFDGGEDLKAKDSEESARAKQSKLYLGRLCVHSLRTALSSFSSFKEAGSKGKAESNRIFLQLYDSAKELDWETCLAADEKYEIPLRIFREMIALQTPGDGVDNNEDEKSSVETMDALRKQFALAFSNVDDRLRKLISRKFATRKYQEKKRMEAGILYPSIDQVIKMESTSSHTSPVPQNSKAEKAPRGQLRDKPTKQVRSRTQRRMVVEDSDSDPDSDEEQPALKKQRKGEKKGSGAGDAQDASGLKDFPIVRRYRDGSTYNCKVVTDTRELTKKDVSEHLYCKIIST